MSEVRVVHYLNQFFAGIGGERHADCAPSARGGPVGPGIALQAAIGTEGRVVATVYCGDDRVSSGDSAVSEIVSLIASFEPTVVVAGPAFASGRYGMACGAVARAVEERLQVPAVAGMADDNPAVDVYRGCLLIVRTDSSPARTAEATAALARIALKRAAGRSLGDPQQEGYFGRGIRQNVLAEASSAVRVVDMLLRKLGGMPPRSEIPVPRIEPLTLAPALADLRTACLALITSGGVVPRGNPDRIEARRASRWSRFSIRGVDDLAEDRFECVHGGFDNQLVARDPDRVLPVDVMRQLEREGRIGRLHDVCYATVGAGAALATAARFGKEIGDELLAAGVQAAILTAT
jgi:glycine reductase